MVERSKQVRLMVILLFLLLLLLLMMIMKTMTIVCVLSFHRLVRFVENKDERIPFSRLSTELAEAKWPSDSKSDDISSS